MKKYLAISFIIAVSIIFLSYTVQRTDKSYLNKDDNIKAVPTDTEITATLKPTIASTHIPTITPNITSSNKNDIIDYTNTNKPFTEGVRIKKYPGNYACFQFVTPDGFKIISDPFVIGKKIHPDVVTESHQDMDHNDVSNLKKPFKLLTVPGEYKTKHIVIKGYAGKHNKGDDGDTNNIFVFTIDGIKIAHFASQGELPPPKVLEKIGKVDVILIQIFEDPAASKLIMDDVDIILKSLKPKIVIPEHGDTNAGKNLAEHLNIKEEYITNGEIIITRDNIDKINGIHVINLDTVIKLQN